MHYAHGHTMFSPDNGNGCLTLCAGTCGQLIPAKLGHPSGQRCDECQAALIAAVRVQRIVGKLSNRAKILLAVIREACKPRGQEGGTYYVPSAYPVWCTMFPGDSIQVSGSGDARIIRSLVKHGLAVKRPITEYACEITEAGIAVYDALRADSWVQEFQAKAAAKQAALDAETE